MSTTVTGTATFGMDAFSSLAVVPSSNTARGTITFTSAAPKSDRPSFTAKLQAKEFGPFLVPMSVSIVVEDGSCTYQLTGNSGGYSYDSSNNVTGLVGPDGGVFSFSSLGKQRVVGYELQQPAEITKPCRALGSLVARFGNGHWTSIVGTPTLTQAHTGWDGSGVANGITSITGMPDMLKYVPSADTGEAIRLQSVGTNLYTPSVGGKLMLAVYIASLPGYQAAGTVQGNIDLTISTHASNDTNALFVSFNSNQLREGWNFLKFVMRDPLAYTSGGGGTEYHPFGVSVTSYGTGADTNIVSNAITRMRIDTRNLNGATLYFDSIWTGWESDAQVVLGNDGGVNVLEYALPIFQSHGWKGYGAFPFNTTDTGTSTNTVQTAPASGSDSIAATLYAAGWDIINHTATHPNLGAYSSDAAIAYQVDAAKNYWIEKGYVRGSEFYASPGSSSSRLSEAVIKARGYKLQRHARKWNTSVTPWGVDNPQFIGSIDIGTASSGSGVTSIASGSASTVTGWQEATKIKRAIDVAVAYQDTLFMFWHGITTTGDTGTGDDATGDNLLLTKSAFEAVAAYLRQLELAGSLRVCAGMSGFYYGG